MENMTNKMSRRGVALAAGLAAVAARGNAQTTMPAAETTSDLAILNYALTLEHLEAAFYTRGLEALQQSAFNDSDLARVLGPGVVGGVYANLRRIRDHEVAHVEAIRTTIRSLGGTPVEPCTYNFTFGSPDSFLMTAMKLEELGVAAYNGAIGKLMARPLRAAGASIATVEGRHAAYLSLLVSAIPFPRAFDEAKTMAEVLAAAAPFLASCPTAPGTGTGTGTKAVLLPKNLTTAMRQVALDATQSTAADGGALTYQLRSVTGNAAVIQGTTARPSVQFAGGFGDYVFELTVTDASGMTAKDQITVRYVGN